jgi:hypothetical protein
MSNSVKVVIVLVVLSVVAFLSYFFISYRTKGVFRKFHGIFLAVETKDVDLYASLLPKPLMMPERPTIYICIIDYESVGPWPMTRYQEGNVALRCKYNGVEGWHVKTMPVTKQFQCTAGRILGFPKYVADEISLRQTGDNWLGEVRHGGRTMLSVQYKRGLTRKLAAWEKTLDSAHHLEEPLYLFVPPDKGPRFQQVTVEKVKPDQWKAEVGMARIIIDKSEPWAGLIPPDTEVPAFFQQFTGGKVLVAKKLN